MEIHNSRPTHRDWRLIGPAVGLAGLALTLLGYGCFWIGETPGGWYRYRTVAYPGILLIGLGASLIYRERSRIDSMTTRVKPPIPRTCPTCGRTNATDAWHCEHCDHSLDWDPGQPSS